MQRLVNALGLQNFVNVPAIKAFAEAVETALENPEALVSELTGIDISGEIAKFIDQIPTVEDYISVETINLDVIGYFPLIDPFGPYAFYPEHCYPDGVGKPGIEDYGKYNSPIIAYIRTGSDIEDDIIDSLTSLFKF